MYHESHLWPLFNPRHVFVWLLAACDYLIVGWRDLCTSTLQKSYQQSQVSRARKMMQQLDRTCPVLIRFILFWSVFERCAHLFLFYFLNVNIWAHLLQAHPSPIYSSAIPFTPRAIRRLKWQLAASPRSHFERTHPTAPNKRLIQQSYSGGGGGGQCEAMIGEAEPRRDSGSYITQAAVCCDACVSRSQWSSSRPSQATPWHSVRDASSVKSTRLLFCERWWSSWSLSL